LFEPETELKAVPEPELEAHREPEPEAETEPRIPLHPTAGPHCGPQARLSCHRSWALPETETEPEP
jgi:hypothetical protein